MKKFPETDTFIYIIFFGVCVFVLLQSPLAPYAKSIIGVDSGIYIYSARQILNGQLMYKDIVDIKGPFLYFINAFALLIFNRHLIGIWFFEVFSLFAASIIMYKTARLFAGKISSSMAVVGCLFLLMLCLQRGNMTEEWSLPYISAALYIFADYLKRNKPLTIVRLFILSLAFVLTFMLRANLISLWAGFGIVLLIKWVKEKKYKELIRNLSVIVLFTALCVTPFFLYFYLTGTLSDAIYWVFTFNMFEYASEINVFKSVLDTVVKISYVGIIIPFLIAIYMFFRDKTTVTAGILVSLVFTVLACSLGRGFWHYYVNFIPLLVIPYSYLFTIIKDNIHKKLYIFIFILFIAFNAVLVEKHSRRVYDNYFGKNERKLKMEKLTEIIDRNTKPSDEILVNGYRAYVYLYSNRTCATRFSHTQNESAFVRENYKSDAEKALPKLIILDNVNYGDCFNLDSLLHDRYQLADSVDDNVIYWKMKIWKLKE